MRPCRTAGGIRQPRARRSRAASGFDSPWHKRARFGETVRKAYLCISEKRNGAGFSSFRIFRADYLIRAAKTILYERENYKQERENLLGDNFCDVL